MRFVVAVAVAASFSDASVVIDLLLLFLLFCLFLFHFHSNKKQIVKLVAILIDVTPLKMFDNLKFTFAFRSSEYLYYIILAHFFYAADKVIAAIVRAKTKKPKSY